ncbi:ParE toxin of type II toxin-antitoxin system, parDE [uncultured archaeon]|nr:ParE toxin of type II toxin-antitoxin system, parDE [uncultured archaeon]
MPYDIKFDEKIEQEFEKLKKKDKGLYTETMKKILRIVENPFLGKPLRNVLKGKYRVHIGHFVLIYEVDNEAHQIIIITLAHHDDAYR